MPKRAKRAPVFELEYPCDTPSEVAKPPVPVRQMALEDLDRERKNSVQFRIELKPQSPEFLKTCRRVGLELGLSPEDLKRRLASFEPRLVMSKWISIEHPVQVAWNPESDPTGEDCLNEAMAQTEKAVRTRIEERRRTMVEAFNENAEPARVPLIAPPKKRRQARSEGRVSDELKREWCALHFVFGWRVGEDPKQAMRSSRIQRPQHAPAQPKALEKTIVRDWNPSKQTRQAIESVLREFGADLGLTRLDFRTPEERQTSAKTS